MFKFLTLAAALTVLTAPTLFPTEALAQTTRVMIRAQSLDAKFIGDAMGGVNITLTDARTGRVLTRGLTKGGTGDTAKVVVAPRVRGAGVTNAATAGFEAVLDLDQPTLIRVEAVGPAGKPGAAVTVSSMLWVIPGRDVLGDGLILTFPGLVVEPTATPAADGSLAVKAKVSPMCGCPIDTAGLWPAANYSVEATLMKGNRIVAEGPLSFTGRTGEFAGALKAAAPGRYRLRIVATDAKTPNAGVAEQAVRVGRAHARR